jgi:HSP20 family protein
MLPRKPKVLSIPARRKWKEPEPLIDVLECENELTVVAGLVGFKKEDLTVRVKSSRLTLSAEASDRKYRKSLNLPALVIPKTMRITYKNGVLEIRLKKGTEEKTIDKVAG